MKIHYPGDVTPFDGSQLLGPDRDSAVYAATHAVHDPDTNRTTVTVRPLLGEERNERIKKMIVDEQRTMRIRRLLVGPVR